MEFDETTIYRLFGAEAAEDEEPERLKAYFFRNRAYQGVRAELPLRVLVGHKGIGKSALLTMSYLEDLENHQLSIQLKPNDVHFAFDRTMSFISKIEEIKKSIAKIILNKSLEHVGIGIKESALMNLKLGASKIISTLTEHFQSKIQTLTSDNYVTIAKSFLNKGIVTVYIDDIDRGWRATREDVENISALINACRDLTNEDRRIRFRIGLRTDAYFLYRSFDESTDKIESNVIRLSWSNHDILIVIAKRVANFLGAQVDDEVLQRLPQIEIARHMNEVITERFHGAGHWANQPIHKVLLSLVRRRPRDMVKLLTEAAKEAARNRNEIITTHDLESVFPSYSSGRISDLINEFRSELPDIEKLLYNMRPTKKEMEKKEKKSVYAKDQLIAKISNISQRNAFHFNNRKPATPQALAEFLYKIDFVIARKEREDGSIDRKYFDQNKMLQSQFVDFGYDWEIHPAYRWALQPQSANSVLREIEAIAEG